MDKVKIENIIEAILFATGREMTLIELSFNVGCTIEEAETAIISLDNYYKTNNKGIQLIRIKEAYQMVSNKTYYEYIVRLFNNKAVNISPAAMEVLSIVAYNQDITRAEIEKIRGVNSDSAVNKLIEYNLIEESGRLDLPGRPAIYRITDDFYRVFGINTIDDLPKLEEIKDETKET